MKQDIIPRVWQMAEEEKEHLNWLIDNNAPKEMIEKSQRYLSHFRQRHKEYIEYAEVCHKITANEHWFAWLAGYDNFKYETVTKIYLTRSV